ncbi:MAG: type IV pili twitching motility protein PilT [Planctomycetota bacterium]|nr:MAG: type IV pili twitching motility protein PilT [Planctomycetota bacterium]
MDFNEILTIMVEKRSSDLFLKVGAPPSIRVDGTLERIGDDPINPEKMQEYFNKVANKFMLEKFNQDHEADSSYEIQGIGRFRVNVFWQRGKVSMVLRHVASHIPKFEDLGLPVKGLTSLCTRPRGLVLVTGITGSGKSTTIASMLQLINQTEKKHILTLEDPIEFIYEDDQSFFNQREVGMDSRSFVHALKNAMRESPDVILIGEMRDQETMEAAINAAETGHLVFSTLHSVDAMQTVDRIINFFPHHQHNLIRMQLSMVLEGVVSQRLLKRSDGPGRVAVVEIMVASPTVRQILLEGETLGLYKAIKEGEYFGSQTFNTHLRTLVDKKIITKEDALRASDKPDELALEFKGISKGSKSSDFFDN